MSQYEYETEAESEEFMRPWGRRWGGRGYGRYGRRRWGGGYGRRFQSWDGGGGDAGGGGGGDGDDGEYEFEGEFELNEVQEMELASELLEITNEAELEEFLGGLVNAAGSFLKSGAGKALGGMLKDVAKTALPVVGGALGSFVAPGIGTAIGSQLGSMASNLFEMGYETEMENEQFEAARKVVQLATKAAQIAQTAPDHVPPQVVAQQAIAEAAQDLGLHPGAPAQGHAPAPGPGFGPGPGPGFGPGPGPASAHGQPGFEEGWGGGGGQGPRRHHHHHRHHGRRQGHWERHGDRIVLYGV